MTEILPSGVLWDMDGTIVDTEPYWMQAEEELFQEFGLSWTHEDSLQVVGASLSHAAQVFIAHGVPMEESAIIDRLTTQVMNQIAIAVPWRPGARELLAELLEAGIPCCLVTMSYRRMAQLVSDAIGFPAFAAVIGGDDVVNGKPHPEPYIMGAAKLGVPVTECIAIEDSYTGLASAVASGAVTIGVPAHLTLDEESGYTLWPTLEGMTVADLGELYRNVRTEPKELAR